MEQNSSPSREHAGDLETARAALGCSGPVKIPPGVRAAATSPASGEPPRSARANRRGALGLLLVAVLTGGVFQLLTAVPDTRSERAAGSRASVVFRNAQSGACLTWPTDAPDKPSFVQCRDDHKFEVAKSVEMSNFGAPCQSAVQQYLGPKYDPDSRFTIGVLWAGDADQPENGKLLCGLQLLGLDGKPVTFKGQVAGQDQSRVWAAGTCLGYDSGTKRSTGVPTDCVRPHAVEVTGSVNLADRFPGAAPPESEQNGFVEAECTRVTEAYLAPIPIEATGLVLSYDTLSQDSWAAGSRQVPCSVASPGENGLEPLVGSIKGPAAGDAAPAAPAAPPPAPAEPPPPPAAAVEPPTPAPTSAPSTPATPSSPSPEAGTSPEPSTPSTPTSPSSAAPSPASPSPSPSPAPLGPAPGPAAPPPPQPEPGVIQIPGLPPIYLPGYSPPPPPAAPEPLPSTPPL